VITSVVPEVKLGDYKKIAKEEMAKKEVAPDISEKELEDAILRIRKSRADHSGHDHEKMTHEEHEKLVEASLPEFNDAFVTSLGGFKDVADFKGKIKESLLEAKKERGVEKRRIIISDKLIETSTIEIPDILVETELRRIEAQFNDDITQMGVTLEDYLKHAKKTIEDLRKDWKPSAEKKAKLQLILNKIASDEKIIVDPKDIEAEVNHIVEHYKDADRERAAVYAETVLMNEKVFKFLEEQK
jgi:trigger factor